MYVLSKLRSSECPNITSYAPIVSDTKSSLIIAKSNKIDIFDISENGLNLLNTLHTYGTVSAMNHFKPPGLSKHWLIILTETNNLYFVSYNSDNDQFMIMEDFSMIGTGLQSSVDGVQIIVVDKANRYIMIHSYQGFIQVIGINQQATEEFQRYTKSHKASVATKKRARVPSLSSFFYPPCILRSGPLTIHSIVPLQNTSDDIYIKVARNPKFTFGLEYFKIKQHGKKFAFESLKSLEIPSEPFKVIPMNQGGVIVACEQYLYYYPNPNHAVEIAEHSDVSISEIESNIIRKDMMPEIKIDSFIVIDNERVLLTTVKGETYMMLFETTSTTPTISINNWKLFDLGMSTIADTIININCGMFFASSRYSESLIFYITSQKPYINIVQYIASSGPIVDLVPSFEDGLFNVLTCSGSIYGGDIKLHGNFTDAKTIQQFNNINSPYEHVETIYDGDDIYLVCKKFKFTEIWMIEVKEQGKELSVQLSTPLNDGTVQNRSIDKFSPLRIEHKLMDFKIINKQHYYITDNVISTPSFTSTFSIIWGKIIDENYFIFQTDDNEIHAHFKGKTKRVARFDESISSFSLGGNKGEYFVFCFWDGSVHIFQSNGFKKLYQISVCSDIPITTCHIFIQKKYSIIMVGNVDGELFYFRAKDPAKSSKFELKSFKFGKMPFKILSFSDKVILTNSNSHAIVSFDESNFLFKPAVMNIPSNCALSTILKSGTYPLILALTSDNNLKVIQVEHESNEGALTKQTKTLFVPVLPRKVIRIPETNYAVSLLIHEDVSKIVLIDILTMQILDIYKFEEGLSVTSMCSAKYNLEELSTHVIKEINPEMEEMLKYGFLTLANSTESTLSFFTVRSSKIVLKVTSKPINMPTTPVPVKFYSIKNLYSNYFIISGNRTKVYELKMYQDNSFMFTCKTEELLSDFSLVCAIKKFNSKVVICDLHDGFFEAVAAPNIDSYDKLSSEANFHSRKIDHVRLDFFCFDFDLISENEIVYSDVIGNVVVQNIEDGSKLSLFNISEQINCVERVDRRNYGANTPQEVQPIAILGSASGGIYLLSYIQNAEKCEVLLKCQEEIGRQMSYMTSLKTPDEQYEKYLKLRDYKKVDGSTVDHINLIDFTLINNYFKFSLSGPEMKKNFPVCTANKKTLEELNEVLKVI